MSKLKEQFEKKLAAMSNSELASRFNKEVGNTGWGNARAAFLATLHAEFTRRGIDASVVTHSCGLKLSKGYEVSAHGNKFLLTDNEALYRRYDHELHLHFAFGKSTVKRKFTARSVPVFNTNLAVLNELTGTQERVLFEIKHVFLQTLLDLTNLPPCLLYHFDEQANFVSESRVETGSGAPFMLLSQSRYIILMPDRGMLSKKLLGFSSKPISVNRK